MQEKKSNAKLQGIFSAICLVLIFTIELYAMINLPQQYIIIGVLAVAMLLCVYVLMHALMTVLAEKEAHREEQYDSVFKSEKASYLMLKKYFEEIEEKLEALEKTSKVPTEEIVGTQKGIGKVIINRSRENAEAIISSNDILMDTINHLEDALDSKNSELLSSYKSISEDSVQQMARKQQDMLMSLKDMEIRLSNAIMQSQKVVTQAAPVYATPMMTATTQQVVSQPVPMEIPQSEEPIVEDFIPEPIMEEAPVPVEEPEPVVAESMPEPVVAEPLPEPVVAEPLPESVVEEVPAPAVDLSDPNKKMDPDEIAALFASMSGDVTPAEEPNSVVEEPLPEPVIEQETTPAAQEVDLSDPNKQLGPDEIAALFASMTQEVTESAPESEPVVEEEPAQSAPAIDLSDPNKQLSPDEIAALFSSMGA